MLQSGIPVFEGIWLQNLVCLLMCWFLSFIAECKPKSLTAEQLITFKVVLLPRADAVCALFCSCMLVYNSLHAVGVMLK